MNIGLNIYNQDLLIVTLSDSIISGASETQGLITEGYRLQADIPGMTCVLFLEQRK